MRLVDPDDLMRVRALSGLPPISQSGILPGLSPSEIRSVVEAGAYPEVTAFVDNTIEEWWSWHDGLELGRTPFTPPVIAPDGFSLSTLERLLPSTVSMCFGPLGADRYDPSTQFFPISYTEMGDMHWLYRADGTQPWAIGWADSKEEMIPPHKDRDGPQVLFSEYLDALVAIDQPWLSLPTNNYPWC